MTTLYVIRHAKATGQPAESPLTPEGQADALRLAEHLAGAGIKRIIASPFLRAQQTAAPLAECLALPVQIDDRLAERILAKGPLCDWQERLEASFVDLDLRCPGGETSREARTRAVAAVSAALGRGRETTAIVSHGNLLTLLLGHYDPSFGFASWTAMANPDVFKILFDGESARVERDWT